MLASSGGNKFAVSGFDEKMQFIEWSRQPCRRSGRKQKATIPTKLSTKRKLNYWKMSFCHRNDAKVRKI